MSDHRQIVRLPSGVSLEAEWIDRPIIGSEKAKLAICLHPWSRLGGTMDDSVLRALILGPLRKYTYHVLSFNCRGVGRSTGSASYTGLSEAQDLEDMVKWAIETITTEVDSLVIIGYSYGSLIASLHPVLPQPIKTFHVLLSYPLGPRWLLTLFHGTTYAEGLDGLVRNRESNVLVVYGNADEFTGEERYDEWRKELERAAVGNLRVVKVEGGTHFWRDGEMIQVIEQWLP